LENIQGSFANIWGSFEMHLGLCLKNASRADLTKCKSYFENEKSYTPRLSVLLLIAPASTPE